MKIKKLFAYAALLCGVPQLVQSSNYDPHYPSSGEGLWFEGWYTRIVDFTNQRAFATVLGSYCANDVDCNDMQDLPGYLAFIYTNFSDKFDVIETFPNSTYIDVGPNDAPVSTNPDFASPPDFVWKTPDYGTFTNGTISFAFPEQGYAFKAVMTDPVFWDPSVPGEGPEGLVMDLPLQQHWFVYSLGSAVSYSFTTPDGEVSGTGFAHQEKNWGSSFPSEWIWAEAVSADNLHHFSLSGGEVPLIGPVGVHAWLIGYRSPNITWNFRPQDIPTIFTPTINACNGTFQMEANYLTQTLNISISAPVLTFTPLAIPSTSGFVPDGCVESYSAETYIQVWEAGTLIEEYTFTNSALEFGGGYLCK